MLAKLLHIVVLITENTDMAAKWKSLRNPKFPILFHSVDGIERYNDNCR